MKINDFSLALGEIADVIPLNSFEWEVRTKATFINDDPIVVHILKEGNSWYFIDNKETLKFMNEIYDLKSSDVKRCISAVIKIYGFTIASGSLKALVPDEVSIQKTFFDYIMCIGQLANMYAFFDKPE